MTNNINPLRFGITENKYVIKDKNDELNKKSTEGKQGEKQNKEVDSKEVLGYLAAQNLDMVPLQAKKNVDVSKYVSSEQEARIAEFMKGFEADYDEAFSIAKNEFPEVSDKLAGDLALSYINASY